MIFKPLARPSVKRTAASSIQLPKGVQTVRRKAIVCSNCGAANSFRYKVFSIRGQKLKSPLLGKQNRNGNVITGYKFCTECGMKLVLVEEI